MTVHKRQRESLIKTAIVRWLCSQPDTYAWVNHTTGIPIGRTGGFRCNFNRGIADICGVKKVNIGCKTIGRFFCMEVKSEKGIVSDLQRLWLERIDEVGGYACVVRSVEDAEQAWREV